MQISKPIIHSSPKRKLTANQLKAKAEHEKWLTSIGAHPKHLAAKKNDYKNEKPKYVLDNTKLSNTIQDGGRATGVMANLYKEKPHVRNQILSKASGVTQLYNKVGYSVAVPSDGKILGSSTRRN